MTTQDNRWQRNDDVTNFKQLKNRKQQSTAVTVEERRNKHTGKNLFEHSKAKRRQN